MPASTMSGASDKPEKTESPQLVGLVERTLGQTATFAAIFAGTVGLLYVIGGTVMWLRFEKAGLPADRAVALVPQTDLLVLGLRVMVLPALASAALLLSLGAMWRTRQARLASLRAEAERLKEPEEGEQTTARERMDELDEEIRKTETLPRQQLPNPRSSPIRFALLAGVALLVALLVPFSAGALAWPIALVALLWYWLHLTSEQKFERGEALPIWRLSLAAALAASFISVARQTVPPVQLVSVQADLEKPSRLLAGSFGVPRDGDGPVSGVLVAITRDTVNIGDAADHSIVSIPRRGVSSLTIGPPLDQRAPPSSLLSRLLSERAWAITPLELWCENLKYGWAHIGDACQADPDLLVDDTLVIAENRVDGVRVHCPGEAEDGCRGFVTIVTTSPGESPSDVRVLPVTIRRNFAFDHALTDDVRLIVDEDALWDTLGGEVPERGRPKALHVDVRIVLSLDAARDAVIGAVDGKMVISAPKKGHKGKPNDTDDDDDTGGTPGGEGTPSVTPDPGGGDPTPDPTPDSTATPEPTPEVTDPLPPPEDTIEAPTPDPEATP